MQEKAVYCGKKFALMIRYTPASERKLSLFKTPFEQSLSPENRWVKMAELVPWDDFASVLQKRMCKDNGRGSIDLRVVLGALLVKYVMNLSDEETIRYIEENIYVQYFVGLPAFQKEQVFTPSLFVTLRRRLGLEGVNKMNELLLERAKELKLVHNGKYKESLKQSGKGEKGKDKGRNKDGGEDVLSSAGAEKRNEKGEVTHKGVLKLDATVAPQNIKYPTDVNLVAASREMSESLLDKLYDTNKSLWPKKPRTYRRKARASYVKFSKKRSKSRKASRQERKRQLSYLRRNIKHIEGMLDKLESLGVEICWEHKDWKMFWVIQEVYRQQLAMHRSGEQRIDHRIVSVFQPYVRPIKRGKNGKDTEFGAKLHVIEVDGFVMLEYVDYENYNEANRLKSSVEHYRGVFGYYPSCLLADRIYLNRENRAWLKEKGIAHYGVPLGRPPKMSASEKSARKKIQNKRSEIEGKFGVAKIKYGLNCIRTKQDDTSYAGIALLLLAFNVFTLSQALIFSFFRFLRGENGLYWPIKALVMRLKGRFTKLAFADFSHRQLAFSYRSLILPRFTG